jgi:hypothetical protein
METQEQIGKRISYDHLSPDDKHYFGGFLNLAQINIDSVIQEFCVRLNLKYIRKRQNDILFNQYFKDNVSETEWERGVNILKEYWPVISFLDFPESGKLFEHLPPKERRSAKRKHFKHTLGMLFTAVNDLRNYYTHYYHDPITLPDDLFTFLDNALFATVIDVKKTKMKDDKTRQLLKEGIQKELTKLIALKKEELKEKKKKNAKINLNDEKGIVNSVYNDAFAHFLFTDGTTKQEELSIYYKSKLSDQSIAQTGVMISASGLIFLLSMFLSKKEVEQLKSNIEGYKGKVLNVEKEVEKEVDKRHNSLKYMATHWVFSGLAFKGVKQRLTNTFEKESLLIQMMDELNKVPDEVYQTLSEERKKEFLEDMNEYISETNKEDENPLYVVHPVIRKRYEDKFSYFAIRFLDEFAGFPTLRFQIFAGHYLHDSRPKQIGSANIIADRNIKERINVFGRLSETVKLKDDYFTNNPPEEGWELFPNPSYNWVTNNIPVHIDLIKKEARAKEMQRHINQLQKRLNPPQKRIRRIEKKDIISLVYKKSVATGDPTLLLSNNELMAMLYELLVNKKSGAEIEYHIVDKIIERYDLITLYTPDKEKIAKSLIPQKLQNSRIGQAIIDYTKLLRAIETEIANGEDKLTMIASHRKELNDALQDAQKNRFKSQKGKRKYLFYISEMGQEATWIANDLKRFMPLAARAVWKGYQHSEFQRMLAFYDTQHDEARQLLESVWNMSVHPYWGAAFREAFQQRDFVNFYTRYLKVRAEILTGFAESLRRNTDEPKIIKKVLAELFIVFDKRLYRINATDKQKEELLAKPFVFPRGLFDDKPTMIPGCKPQENPEKFADWYIYGYQYQGKYQAFYEMEKEYTTLYKTRKEKGKLPLLDGMDENRKKERFRMDCDLKIKRIKFQDIYVKLMVDKLFEDTFGQKPEFDLSRLYDTRNERYQNEMKALEQKDRKPGDDSVNIRNENYVWNKPFPVSLYDGRIVEPEVKLKDVGKFRRFAADPKVATLIAYDEGRIWNKLEIEDELENKAFSYETIRRTELLKNIHRFEKYILEQNHFDGWHHPDEFTTVRGNPNFRMYIGNGVLKKIVGISPEEIRLIAESRFETIGIEQIKQCGLLTQKAYVLILLRNKFGHNQLPDKVHFEFIRSLFSDVQQESYSNYFNRVSREIIDDLKASI